MIMSSGLKCIEEIVYYVIKKGLQYNGFLYGPLNMLCCTVCACISVIIYILNKMHFLSRTK